MKEDSISLLCLLALAKALLHSIVKYDPSYMFD